MTDAPRADAGSSVESAVLHRLLRLHCLEAEVESGACAPLPTAATGALVAVERGLPASNPFSEQFLMAFNGQIDLRIA